MHIAYNFSAWQSLAVPSNLLKMLHFSGAPWWAGKLLLVRARGDTIDDQDKVPVCNAGRSAGACRAELCRDLTFDNEGAATGNLTYNGTTTVTGTNITFDDFDVSGAPVDNGDAIFCEACVLNFTSGNNTDETLPVYEWGGPGTITISGTIGPAPAGAIIATGTLMTGTFSSLSGTFGAGSLGLVGLGIDTKHADILSFFQILNPGTFTSTNIASANCTPAAGGAFNCAVTEADTQNLSPNQVVPEPATLILFGLGLAGAGRMSMRRRRSSDPWSTGRSEQPAQWGQN